MNTLFMILFKSYDGLHINRKIHESIHPSVGGTDILRRQQIFCLENVYL